MRQILIKISIFTLVIFSLTSQAMAASPKSGGPCTKLGSNSKTSGYSLTCLKIGSKLIWKSSSSKTVSTSINIPISLPVSLNSNLNFDNSVAQVNDLPSISWQKVQDLIAKNSDPNIPTNISIGPNTDASKDLIISSLHRSYKLFSGFKQPPSYTGIAYNAKDESWAETEWPKIAEHLNLKIRPSDYNRIIRNGCSFTNNVASECWGGNSASFAHVGSEIGFSFYGVQNGNFWSDLNAETGPASQIDHEYTHNVQFAQFNGVPFKSGQFGRPDQSHAAVPWWFTEGQAQAIGISVFSLTKDKYLATRNNLVIRPGGPESTLHSFTAESLKNFLTENLPAGPGNPNWPLGYSVGFAAVEALSAIGGPQSTMVLFDRAAIGDDWPTAFKNVYGISWEKGATVLGEILAAEYASHPMK